MQGECTFCIRYLIMCVIYSCCLLCTQEVALKATRPVFVVAGGVAGGIYLICFEKNLLNPNE